ncbi:DNA recombination protein RmuC [Geomonas sp. RF6]|uniref:DNA recombination protein RmuC n=1 Tax=Geomonas sp. RF6 TaxID=2897342 RepID=UPI001E49A13C|nr:DNA recombination protein RmuC [Geomonas sp. RF6]UFS72609.1 DNA recombination protein RmuC [Geomonas sp. RF6]
MSPFEIVSLILLCATLIVALLCLLTIRRSALERGRLDALERSLERLERTFQGELGRNREELSGTMRLFGDSLQKRMVEIATMQKGQLEGVTQHIAGLSAGNEQRLEKLRETVELRLKWLQEDNGKKLEQMRAVVDEKLHQTLEKRLGESFRLVSERLELVHKGLGEMRNLAAGVGDLKRVLSNVKTRGTMGEIQLGTLLEQILTPAQYSCNVATRRGSSARVEFALRLPGHGEQEVFLPLDAKFPQEDYLRLVEAREAGDPALVEEVQKQLEKTVREMARLIRDKYLDPPHTTDFAIMFLPTEGLYAEVLCRAGLFELLQRKFRVIITGPTTLAALLNSLQMGFRTLTIEKRSSEVWRLLGSVKTEFGSFGAILEKTKKKLEEAGNSIDSAARRSRAIEKRLKDVQEDAAPELISPSQQYLEEYEGDGAEAAPLS